MRGRCSLLECPEPISRAAFCDFHLNKLPDELRKRWVRSWNGKGRTDWMKLFGEVCAAARAEVVAPTDVQSSLFDSSTTKENT